VFVGSFTLEAVEAICAAPADAEPLEMDVLAGLEPLVDQSLVQPGEDGTCESRFYLLHVIREYALERLEASGEAEALRVAHAAYFLAIAEEAERELAGPSVAAALSQLEQEHDNFRAILGWACASSPAHAQTGLRLAAVLARFWRARGYLGEGRSWLDKLLKVAAPAVAGEMSFVGGVDAVSAPQAEVLVSAAVWARAADAVGWLALWQRADAPAREWLEAAAIVARAVGELRTAADALGGLGVLALQQRDLGQAAVWFEESLALARESSASADIVQLVLRHQGWVAYQQGDLARAATCFEEGYGLVQQMGDLWGQAIWQSNLGELALLTSDLAQAETMGREALKRFLALVASVDIAINLELLAMAAAASEQSKLVATLLGAAATAHALVGAPLTETAREDIDREITAARAALGEERCAAAFAAGRALSREEAIAEALGEDEAAAD
jgi:tetratricopeptide (TPR) repeat protein